MQSLVTFASYGMDGTISWRLFFYDNNRLFFLSMFEILSEGKGERILDLLSDDAVECVLQQSVIKGLQEVVFDQTPWTFLIGLSILWLCDFSLNCISCCRLLRIPIEYSQLTWVLRCCASLVSNLHFLLLFRIKISDHTNVLAAGCPFKSWRCWELGCTWYFKAQHGCNKC